jgi:hypothetical protein
MRPKNENADGTLLHDSAYLANNPTMSYEQPTG